MGRDAHGFYESLLNLGSTWGQQRRKGIFNTARQWFAGLGDRMTFFELDFFRRNIDSREFVFCRILTALEFPKRLLDPNYF